MKKIIRLIGNNLKILRLPLIPEHDRCVRQQAVLSEVPHLYVQQTDHLNFLERSNPE